MTEEPPEKPCGRHHPLPCGLDKDCPVPPEYYKVNHTSQYAWERYKAEGY